MSKFFLLKKNYSLCNMSVCIKKKKSAQYTFKKKCCKIFYVNKFL